MSGALTLAFGPEPVEVPLLGLVEVRASVPFWIGDTLHAAAHPHRMYLQRREAVVRSFKGREGSLQVRSRKVRGEALQGSE